jgi:hypothetical protein
MRHTHELASEFSLYNDLFGGRAPVYRFDSTTEYAVTVFQLWPLSPELLGYSAFRSDLVPWWFIGKTTHEIDHNRDIRITALLCSYIIYAHTDVIRS